MHTNIYTYSPLRYLFTPRLTVWSHKGGVVSDAAVLLSEGQRLRAHRKSDIAAVVRRAGESALRPAGC